MGKLETNHEYAQLPLDSIQEYDKNPNFHSEKHVSEIVASIKEFGFTNPILVDEENMIIAGHGRYKAAKVLDYEMAPCVILRGLTDVQKKAYVIADNALPKGAVWDQALLEAELEFLESEEFDLDILGIDYIDLDEFEPDNINDGHANDPENNVKKRDTKLQIGEYNIPIPREVYQKWNDEIRLDVGFEKKDIIEEIVRRLGICLDS